MSPEVLHKKLASMSTYLNDLLPFKEMRFETFMERHYEIERIIELLIMTACDIIFHLLSAQGEPAPSSYRAAFLRAGEIGMISMDLAKNLALGVGLRNILSMSTKKSTTPSSTKAYRQQSKTLPYSWSRFQRKSNGC